jgi:hypothetical protein
MKGPAGPTGERESWEELAQDPTEEAEVLELIQAQLVNLQEKLRHHAQLLIKFHAGERGQQAMGEAQRAQRRLSEDVQSFQETEAKYDLTPSPRAAATSTSAFEANRRVMAGEAEPDLAAGVPGPPRDFDPQELFLGPKKYSLL